MPQCIFCASTDTAAWFVKDDKFPIVRCGNCGSAFVWPRPEPAQIEAYYRDKSYRPGNLASVRAADANYHPKASDDARRIIAHTKKLSRGQRFLDAGAGFGEFSLEAVRAGLSVSSCDPSPSAREVYKALVGFEPDPDILDEEYAGRHAASFDAVLLSQVLEHTVSPSGVVRNISTVLSPGGLAVIAVPHFASVLSLLQGKNDMFISPPEHLNFFSKKGLIALFGAAGFTVELVETPSKVPTTGRFGRLWPAIYAGLKAFEPLHRGMVLNAYFRKSS